MMAVRARRHTQDPGPPGCGPAGIIRRHRISTGSLRRKLNPGQQAVLVLACLRKGETFASLAAGFGTATAWRYVEETVALLAARAPGLRKAVRDAARAGPFYSGKHNKHGMNLQIEEAAAMLRSWEPLVLNGLLQTEDYARALMAVGDRGCGSPAL